MAGGEGAVAIVFRARFVDGVFQPLGNDNIGCEGFIEFITPFLIILYKSGGVGAGRNQN